MARSNRTSLTSRAAILALVLAALVTTLAFPVRQFIQQRAQLATLQHQIDTRRSQLADLQQQHDQWQDPAFVESQARERLHYVLPGETGYVVLSSKDVVQARHPKLRTTPLPATPWFDSLWQSVAAADGQ